MEESGKTKIKIKVKAPSDETVEVKVPKLIPVSGLARSVAYIIEYLIIPYLIYIYIAKTMPDFFIQLGEVTKIDPKLLSVQLIPLILFILYSPFYLFFSAGPAKAIFGQVIVTLEGEKASLFTLFLREILAKPISVAIFGLGLILGLLRADGRALHDLLAKTIVVETNKRFRRSGRLTFPLVNALISFLLVLAVNVGTDYLSKHSLEYATSLLQLSNTPQKINGGMATNSNSNKPLPTLPTSTNPTIQMLHFKIQQQELELADLRRKLQHMQQASGPSVISTAYAATVPTHLDPTQLYEEIKKVNSIAMMAKLMSTFPNGEKKLLMLIEKKHSDMILQEKLFNYLPSYIKLLPPDTKFNVKALETLFSSYYKAEHFLTSFQAQNSEIKKLININRKIQDSLLQKNKQEFLLRSKLITLYSKDDLREAILILEQMPQELYSDLDILNALYHHRRMPEEYSTYLSSKIKSPSKEVIIFFSTLYMTKRISEIPMGIKTSPEYIKALKQAEKQKIEMAKREDPFKKTRAMSRYDIEREEKRQESLKEVKAALLAGDPSNYIKIVGQAYTLKDNDVSNILKENATKQSVRSMIASNFLSYAHLLITNNPKQDNKLLDSIFRQNYDAAYYLDGSLKNNRMIRKLQKKYKKMQTKLLRENKKAILKLMENPPCCGGASTRGFRLYTELMHPDMLKDLTFLKSVLNASRNIDQGMYNYLSNKVDFNDQKVVDVIFDKYIQENRSSSSPASYLPKELINQKAVWIKLLKINPQIIRGIPRELTENDPKLQKMLGDYYLEHFKKSCTSTREIMTLDLNKKENSRYREVYFNECVYKLGSLPLEFTFKKKEVQQLVNTTYNITRFLNDFQIESIKQLGVSLTPPENIKKLLLAKERIKIVRFLKSERDLEHPEFIRTGFDVYKKLFDQNLLSSKEFRMNLFHSINIRALDKILANQIDFNSEQTMKEIILSKPDRQISYDVHRYYAKNPAFKNLLTQLAPQGLGR